MQIRLKHVLSFVLALGMSGVLFAQVSVGVAVSFGPPPLPVYDQPLCPGDGYIWTPGYWAYDSDVDDYYWVPGTWVMAPEPGFLWTPAWWGWGDGGFMFHEGYWGPLVGFYGGINYGFGYFGVGFEGGRWDHDHFFYNRAVSNVNITEIHNVYNTTVVVHNDNHVSYNGGNGGITARATAQEEAAARERHIPPVAVQTQHFQAARSNPQMRASANMGKPPIAATPRPGDFKDRGVVQAKEAGGRYTPPANHGPGNHGAANHGAANNGAANNGGNRAEGNAASRPENNAGRPSAPTHVRELPPGERPAAPNTGNSKQDQKYQQQQERLYAKQDKERQKVAQQQEKEDQKMSQQHAPQATVQQQEQRHQQQTQQLQQRHQQQQQQMQQRAQPKPQERPKPPKG